MARAAAGSAPRARYKVLANRAYLGEALHKGVA
jgi:hypothetical protein